MAEANGGTRQAEGGRTIAVLGEMLELGDDSLEAHREIGRYAAEQGVEILLGVGNSPNIKQLVLHAGAAGVPNLALAADNETAADFLEKILVPGDRVLMKASRGGMLWQIAQRLTGQPVTGIGDH